MPRSLFKSGSLVALDAISNSALASRELPKRLKLLNWGTNETTKGPVKVGFDTLLRLDSNQQVHGFDRVALDFGHNSLPGHPNYKLDPRELAGFGVPAVVRGDGLYLDQIQYTPTGEKFARNYADLSPTPRLNSAGEVDFLHSVALCPQGSVYGLSFFDIPLPVAPARAPGFQGGPDFKALLLRLLGLPDGADDTQIEDAAHAFVDSNSETRFCMPEHLQAGGGTAVAVRALCAEFNRRRALYGEEVRMRLGVSPAVWRKFNP